MIYIIWFIYTSYDGYNYVLNRFPSEMHAEHAARISAPQYKVLCFFEEEVFQGDELSNSLIGPLISSHLANV